MNKIGLIILVAIIGFVACRKDQETTETTTFPPPGPTIWVKASIGGTIVDETGAGVPNATVRLGQNTTKTDKNGVFYFRDKIVDSKGAYVKVEHPAFFHGSRTLSVGAGTRNTVRIQLLSNASTRFVDAASGGTADYGEYSVALPAKGVSTASGDDFAGQVGVAAKWLNPASTDFGVQMPGRLMGRTTERELSGMVSMGMLAVELKDQAGNKLQVKKGFEAALRMKVPAAIRAKAPATIPLWYFDEAAGIWVEEGEATLSGEFYEGKVKHFSFWNHDYMNPLVEIDFKVVDNEGNPVEGAKVFTQLANAANFGFGFTDNTGHIKGLVPQNELLNASITPAMFGCADPVLEQQIGPFTANGDFTFTISLGNVYEYSITGELLDCNEQPIADGYVLLDGAQEVAFPDAQGHFEINLIRCQPLSSVTLTAYDLSVLKESAPLTLDLGSSGTDVGEISVCGTLQNYLTYTFNGQSSVYVDHKIRLLYDIDSLSADTTKYLTVSRHGDGYNMSFVLRDCDGPGIFSPESSYVEGAENGVQLVQNCDGATCLGLQFIISEYNGLGGYVSGSYSGVIGNSQVPGSTSTISGTFRGILEH